MMPRAGSLSAFASARIVRSLTVACGVADSSRRIVRSFTAPFVAATRSGMLMPRKCRHLRSASFFGTHAARNLRVAAAGNGSHAGTESVRMPAT
jgi:hypothetical protein